MMADGWKQHQERHDEKKEEKKERKESRRPLRHSRNNSDVSVDSVEDVQLSASSNNSLSAVAKGKPAVSGTTSSKSLSSDSAVRAPAPTPSRDPAAHAPLSIPATASSPGSATVTDKPALGTSPPKAVKGQHSPSSGTVTSVMTPLLEKTDHVLASWGFSRGNTMQSKQAEGASTSQVEASGRTGDPDVDASNSVTSVVTPLLEKTDNYLATWGLTTSASNPKSEDGTVVQGSSPSAVQASPPTAVQVSSLSAPQVAAVTTQNGAEEQNIVITADRHKTYSDTDLAEMETAAGPVEEEVFENERFQPFKGWGHGWPGNFLPTDKVGHWSHRNGTPGKAASMAFSTVAPKLPKGWSWVEEGWVVDHQGIADDAVDADGWSYATDFSWLRMPPAPNSGHRSKVRDFVRRRRWIRSRVKKPAESQAGQGASTSSSPIFGHSASSLHVDSRPQLSKVSTTSSTGTGPIFSRPSGMFAGHEGAPAANTSFTSQRNMNTAGQLSPTKGFGAEGVSSSSNLGHSDLANLRGRSSHSLGGAMPGRSSGPDEQPYMNLSDVRSGLSNECSKWGQSVASELHKAISSAGEDNGSLARDSLHSEDYVGNSPMSAGLTRLSGPATSFQSGSASPTAAASYPTTAAVLSQHRLSPQFVRDSTPQTLGTAGGIPVAPQLAQATGHANISAAGSAQSTDSRPTGAAPQGMPSFADRQSAGNVAVQHSTAEDFPASEELTVEDSAPSAPASVFGQVRHGRLQMSEESPLAAFPASSVAAGLAGPSGNAVMMQNIDRDVGHADTTKFEQSSPLGHHHSYEKAGVVLARPADGSAAKFDQ